MAFLTGSRIYGIPKPNSDLDMVIRCDDIDMDGILMDHDEVDQDNHHVSADTSVRFGNLNVIVCENEKEYDCWRRARARCIQEAPVTKKRAIEIHKEERKNNEL